jgi:hypothetical protein
MPRAQLQLLWLVLCDVATHEATSADTPSNMHQLRRWGAEDPPPPMLTNKLKQPKQPRNTRKGDVFLVLGVISAPPNFEWRRSIRSTWWKLVSHQPVSSVLRFVIGWRDDPLLEKRLEAESDVHSDIIRVPVRDTYINLIYKVLQFFDWATANFNFAYLMRVNDNTFLTLDRLLVGSALGY